jgi:hypothetical protein
MQTQTIFSIIYLLAFASYLLISVFIIYHIVRYSGNKAVMLLTVSFFILGTVCLLFANALLFSSIPFDQFVPSLAIPAYSSSSPF